MKFWARLYCFLSLNDRKIPNEYFPAGNTHGIIGKEKYKLSTVYTDYF